jgi:hypothetical protein
MRWYFRWERPGPLTDCCRPSWWLEELLWRAKAWWRYRSPWGRRRVARERAAQDERLKHFQWPEVLAATPILRAEDIVNVQPMTGPVPDGFHIEFKFKRKG